MGTCMLVPVRWVRATQQHKSGLVRLPTLTDMHPHEACQCSRHQQLNSTSNWIKRSFVETVVMVAAQRCSAPDGSGRFRSGSRR